MASTEQPPKKRKPYDPAPPPPPPPPPEPRPPPPQPNVNEPTQEEILQKRRNLEEISKFYEHYKQLKYSIAGKDDRLMPELEKSYLSLIAFSRGCTSVQRLVAEMVPKYASHCPTALEAAAKVCINIHNWSVALIKRGEDADGFSFDTATACIFGLASICQAASSETPTSSVIQGICSAVFLNVLSFFISSFEGQEIFHIVNKDVIKIHDSPNMFSEFKQIFSGEDVPVLVKLSKFRALSFLWIFFSCPRNSLAACFELYSSNSTDAVSNGGQYFLTQLTTSLDSCDVAYPLAGNSDGGKLTGSMGSSSQGKEVSCDGIVSVDNTLLEDAYYKSKGCLLTLVLNKDPSLREWILSRYKKLSKSASASVVSDITSALERIFVSFTQQVEAEGKDADSDEDDSNPPEFISTQLSIPNSNQHGIASEVSARDRSYPGDAADKLSGLHLEQHSSTSVETDIRSNTSSNIDGGGPRSTDIDSMDHRQLSCAGSSTPTDPSNSQMSSATPRVSLDLRSNSFDGRNHFVNTEKNACSGGMNSTFESPKHHMPSPYLSTVQLSHHSDGDQIAMDIYSASGQLWLGSLGPEASEDLVRFQFEKFGPVDSFYHLPYKGCAVIEYRNIMDALKAREVMKGRSPWGACLLIKFLDAGLGTRGDMNGVAVGSSCHVYVGNVPSQGDKDEILNELRRILFKGPLMVNDIASESALLMEFRTPEEAATVIAHLRKRRKEKHEFLPSSVGPASFVMPVDRPRHGSAPLNADLRNKNRGNSIVGSPHPQTMVGFSHPGKHHTNTMEPPPPRVNMVNQGATMQSGYTFQLNWMSSGTKGMVTDVYDSNMVVDASQAGGQVVSGAPERNWMYRNPESVPHSTQGHNIAPPQPIQASSFMRPAYYPPNSSWDARGFTNPAPLNPYPSGVMPSNFLNQSVAPPFLPASVTPLAQIQANSKPQHDQMFYGPPPLTNLPPHPNMPPQLPPHPNMPPALPPHPNMPPPLPPTPPPLLEFQPPPPPPPPVDSPMPGSAVPRPTYQWQGTLSKSGVHYSTIHANRLHSNVCNYSNAVSEPAEWPAKLDITKRTDFRHVMSTFSGTPPNKREVCQLLPTSAGDHKGFQDFISYLKQRECAGVIKIPATKTVWARLIFILPYSQDTCSRLGITPDTKDCLIALVLPKETNFEWV